MVNKAVEEFILNLREEVSLLEREANVLRSARSKTKTVSDEEDMELRRNIGSPQF